MATVQDAIKLAWTIGRLNYAMRRTQIRIKQEWIESREKYRKFYIESTRRLGKSSLLLLLFAEECISSKGRKCGFFAPVKDGLLDYIEPLIQRTFEGCPDELRPRLDRQRFMLRFPNGSNIIFRGSNNQQHRIRRGQEFHLAGIDEARDVDNLENLIESVVFPSLFSTDGYLIISSTPADTRNHPLFRYREQALVEGWFSQISIWEAHEIDPDAYPLELINEWKEEITKAIDGQEIWEREFECKWVINKRKMAVPEWDTSAMAKLFDPDPYYQFYHHYVGIDWGYKDFTALVFATWNFRRARLEVEGELTFQGKDVRSDLIAERIELMSKHLWKDKETYRQVSDSADPILINELNKFKDMGFIPVQKAHTLEAMLNEFRVLVAQGKVFVSPKCRMLINNLETAVWDDKRAKLDQDLFAHHFDHLMALVYLTRMLDVSVNPIPRDFMVDNVRIIDLNFDRKPAETSGGEALQRAFGKRK